MLISRFAEKYNVQIDTIRYYMKLGLLIPKKKNHYYDFDESCASDMEWITELKTYRFTLQEIGKILAIKRVTLYTEKEDYHFLIQMLEEKKHVLSEEIMELKQVVHDMKNKIEDLQAIQSPAIGTKGMPFQFLSFLYCPACQTSLELTNIRTEGQHIMTGELYCSSCSYTAEIDDGIVLTKHLNKKSFNPFYLYDTEMLKTIESSFISLSEKAGHFVKQQLKNQELAGKVVLETHIDTYVLLHKFIEELDQNATYIFTGSTISMLKMLKSRMEKTYPAIDVLYILNSGLDLPFRHGSIDYLIDSYSFNEYSLFHEPLPLVTLGPYLHQSAKMIGCYFTYKDNAHSLVQLEKYYPNANGQNLQSAYIQQNLRQDGFKLIQNQLIGSTNDPGQYLKYHVPGEEAAFYSYLAERDCNKR